MLSRHFVQGDRAPGATDEARLAQRPALRLTNLPGWRALLTRPPRMQLARRRPHEQSPHRQKLHCMQRGIRTSPGWPFGGRRRQQLHRSTGKTCSKMPTETRTRRYDWKHAPWMPTGPMIIRPPLCCHLLTRRANLHRRSVQRFREDKLNVSRDDILHQLAKHKLQISTLAFALGFGGPAQRMVFVLRTFRCCSY